MPQEPFLVTQKMVSAYSTRIFLIKINAQKRLIARKITNSMHGIPKFLDRLVLGGNNWQEDTF